MAFRYSYNQRSFPLISNRIRFVRRDPGALNGERRHSPRNEDIIASVRYRKNTLYKAGHKGQKPHHASDCEALKLLTENPALPPSPEVGNNNFLALTQHIEAQQYPGLVTSMENILEKAEYIITQNSTPHNPQQKEDATLIINLGVKMVLKDANK
uniref:Uncharacterized protein n=1 Tax=Caenorhabditis japonica TaxID=281687 RepID=A0A8R1DK71_CAEJA